MASNHLEVFPVFLAVWKLGGFLVNLTLNLPPSTSVVLFSEPLLIFLSFTGDIEKRVKEMSPKFFVTDVARAPRVKEVLPLLKSVQEAFTVAGFFEGFTPVSVLTVDDGKGIFIEKSSSQIAKLLTC